MSVPPKRKRGPIAALENTNLTVYYSALALQRLGRGAKRKCVVCNAPVTNRNVGGHDGRPISGRVWCQRCADYPAQLLLTFNGVGAP
jgi:hypothetical protein